jgi:hypothetical protein
MKREKREKRKRRICEGKRKNQRQKGRLKGKG